MESMLAIGIVGFVVIAVLKFVLMSPAKVGARGERRVADFAEKDLAVGDAGKAAHVANLKKRHGR